MTTLIVVDGLMEQANGLGLHPDVTPWQDDLQKRHQQWFAASPHHPLSLYASMVGCEAVALLLQNMDLSAKQYWVASPYHARLGRDHVRLMPESMLPWCEEDAHAMCELLNPWLKDEGMALQASGAALYLSCNRVWDVKVDDFALISSSKLPNHPPHGKDGGHWMRLQSEIQMVLNQSPLKHRRQRGDVDIHGLWFWGGCSSQSLLEHELPIQAVETHVPSMPKPFPVATRNAFLQSVADAQDAHIILSEAEKLPLLLGQTESLPKHVFLLGASNMVYLKSCWWGRFQKNTWQPKDVKTESEGLQLLCQYCE